MLLGSLADASLRYAPSPCSSHESSLSSDSRSVAKPTTAECIAHARWINSITNYFILQDYKINKDKLSNADWMISIPIKLLKF